MAAALAYVRSVLNVSFDQLNSLCSMLVATGGKAERSASVTQRDDTSRRAAAREEATAATLHSARRRCGRSLLPSSISRCLICKRNFP